MSWDGDIPVDFEIIIVPVKGWSNHKRIANFAKWIEKDLKSQPNSLVVGFNKMPNLDIYYAADTCFEDKINNQRTFLYKLTNRYKIISSFEKSVFSNKSKTKILMISEPQINIFKDIYKTQDERITILPPGISLDRKQSENYCEIRKECRSEFNIKDDEFLLLQIGSGFRTKGLERSIKAVSNLEKVKLFVIGLDNKRKYQKLANNLNCQNKIKFIGGRNDVPRFLQGADLLVHPALNENTGTVLLEALVAGLPVVCSDICGYANYIKDANAGQIINSPFTQQNFNEILENILNKDSLYEYQTNCIKYANSANLYSLHSDATNFIMDFYKIL